MKIAIIGSGISGLSSALILSQMHDVTVFEAEARLGGHAHTFFATDKTGSKVPIDTGFLVYNQLTYPHFCALLDYLGIETSESDMSLSIKTQNGIQWAGTNLRTVFAQKKNLFTLDFLVMLRDILKFHKHAAENYELAKSNRWNLSDLIQHRKYSNSFVDWYLIPMTGAIWSMTYKDVLNFPAATFMQFCINHRLLQVDNRPIWRTIKNGSINYVNAIAERLKDVRLNHKIEHINNKNNKLELFFANGSELFDKVIFATSAPIAYDLLKKDFPDTANFIARAKTSPNKITLHQDESVMPSNRNVWSSWNVKSSEKSQTSHPIELTYYINKLQPISNEENYFVTLNSDSNFNSEIFKTTYHHPQFDNEMITLQNYLPQAQGFHGIYFAGAWTRYGFHEDGILSAVKVAELLGVQPPWKT